MLAKLRQRYTPEVIRALLAETPWSLPNEARPLHAAAALEAQASKPGALDRLRFAVRLQALELNYHELGGLYDRLGFRELGRRSRYYRRPVEDAILLRAAISAETGDA